MTTPAVSILLPTYNRARFLPKAFEAIRAQAFTDWELVVVDDGSADDTEAVVRAETAGWAQPVRYVRQANAGAYGARNTALDLARGEHVAFYDSDDVWLPHHLADCVGALRDNPDLDWVYGASRVVDHTTGKVLSDNVFFPDGKPLPFLALRGRREGKLKVIEDPRAVECAISSGLYAGLQLSVIRRRVFDDYRFEATRRNEAEDQLLVIHALSAGRRMGHFEGVHLIYYVHDANSCAASNVPATARQFRVLRLLAEGYEGLRHQVRLTPAQDRALTRRLSREYFWRLGYHMLQVPGQEAEALGYLWRGLRLWPTNLGLWKTYLVSRLKVAARRRRPAAQPQCE
jgi:glycosyltransferase involved in cell wall biosynthesis